MPYSILQRQNRRSVDDDHRHHHGKKNRNSEHETHHHSQHLEKDLVKDSSEHTRSTATSISSESSCSHSSRGNVRSYHDTSDKQHQWLHHEKYTISNDHVGKFNRSESFSSCQHRLRLRLQENLLQTTITTSNTATTKTIATISNNDKILQKESIEGGRGDGGGGGLEAIAVTDGASALVSSSLAKSSQPLFNHNRARYVKTGNALWNDVEYYEYRIPVVVRQHQHRPPLIPNQQTSSTPRKVQQQPMSEFARSAYLTASHI
jgi:hypothetical protein